ncbi:MAG TPA: pyridoxamine 5'-phosphate oxidase family protein [Burkholderiaceae bacterium]|nr:pyridoxamine 5'-phosphate oxidase family protein [Burkholderiaceae bacterium]
MSATPHAAAAERLRRAVIDGQAREIDALLTPDAVFMALGKTVEGAGSVRTELLSDAMRQSWRALRWQPAQAIADAVRLTGERNADGNERGVIVTITFAGDGIHKIQQQRVPPQPPAARPLVLPPALREAIDGNLLEKHPMLLSYVGPDGQPVLSFRGSTQVLGDDQLAMWVRNADGAFIRAIRHNPRVALMYRNEDKRSTYQLQGRARVSDAPADRQRIFDAAAPAERAHDFAMLGAAVIVDLDRVEGWAGVGPNGQIDPICLQRGI